MELTCPLPLQYEQIVMAHGGGGRLMQQLLARVVQPTFSNDYLNQQHDSAVFSIGNQRVAFTSDSYVIKPLFFKGGDIGKLDRPMGYAPYKTVEELFSDINRHSTLAAYRHLEANGSVEESTTENIKAEGISENATVEKFVEMMPESERAKPEFAGLRNALSSASPVTPGRPSRIPGARR